MRVSLARGEVRFEDVKWRYALVSLGLDEHCRYRGL